MPGIDPEIVEHRIPLLSDAKPVKQKLRRMRPDWVQKIKEEVTKQIDTGFLMVSQYPTWVANIVPVPKKNGQIRVCVDFRDLNRASPKDNFPLPHIDVLVDNTAGHALLSFMDDFSGYNQIHMAPEDREKTTFIIEWGTYCYLVMPFSLKNVGPTYQRAATTILHDMMHKEVEVYVDDMIAKSKTREGHIPVLKKFFERLRKFCMRLNPQKCTFGVIAGNMLGFMITSRGIEVDPSKIKAVLELKPPEQVSSGLYVYSELPAEPSDFDAASVGKAFDSVLVCEPFIYGMFAGLRRGYGCRKGHLLLKQEDGRMRRTLHRSGEDYLFEKPALTGKLARWLLLLVEFDLEYVTRKSVKGHAVAEFLADHPVDGPEDSDFVFPDEEVLTVVEDVWTLYFDGAANQKGYGIGVLLITPDGSHIPLAFKLNFDVTNNQAEYEVCIVGMEAALTLGVEKLEVIGDSNLVVSQANGDWKVREKS
ncbi:uncharacterized protein LOC131306932 [Rhododendron vialii]|uniref:uncharacterized protein LOC131306932 n=1 Tax=Rhododendron vialii TaxID=182163 RepID=UPI00265DD233|nr:uncharacterized protein LOC131306932 [Rhododendron vialii]